MHTTLKLHRVDPERTLKEYVERRLHFTLSRFTDRIDNLSVRITCSAPGGTQEVNCHITANVRPFGMITAEALEADVYSSVDLCAARFARQCHSTLTRSRDGRLGRMSIRVPDLRSAA